MHNVFKPIAIILVGSAIICGLAVGIAIPLGLIL
ncbi:MAG: hypothetical protein ACJAS4_001974 [Bacteriovoracaceae bacterium]|jgi:hypothetical protein